MMARFARLPLLGAMLLAGSALAGPMPVLDQQNVSLALANQLVDATLEACHAEDHTAVVAVVDRGGNLVALKRDDNIGPHNTKAAQRKAYTSLSTKSTSRELAEHARNDPSSANLTTVDDLLLLGGGVPVRLGGDVIGAIGVAGAGGSAIDEGCAMDGITNTLSEQS